MELENKHFTIIENKELNISSYNLGENFFDDRLSYCMDLEYFGSTGVSSARDLLNQNTLDTIIKLN
jgi:hypothetical protein